MRATAAAIGAIVLTVVLDRAIAETWPAVIAAALMTAGFAIRAGKRPGRASRERWGYRLLAASALAIAVSALAPEIAPAPWLAPFAGILAALVGLSAAIAFRPPRPLAMRGSHSELMLDLTITIAGALLLTWSLAIRELTATPVREWADWVSGGEVASAALFCVVLGLLGLRRPPSGDPGVGLLSLVALACANVAALSIDRLHGRVEGASALAFTGALVFSAALMAFDRRGGSLTVVAPRPRDEWPAVRAHRVVTLLLIVLLGVVGVAAIGADDRVFVAGGLVIALLLLLRITLAFERTVTPGVLPSPRTGRDPVTGLVAGRAFLDQAGADLAQSAGRPVGVALIKLDHLDDIAEAFGPRAGEHVLRAAAHQVRRRTRAGDVLARSADAELALLVNGADAIEASRIGQRVADEIARLRYRVGDREVGAAVGIAIARGGPVTELIDLADRALTAATRGRLQRVRVMELGGTIQPLVIRSASLGQSTGSGIRHR